MMKILAAGQFLVSLMVTLALMGYVVMVSADDARSSRPYEAVAASTATAATASAVTAVEFQPPAESSLADDDFGKVVRQGENIFTHTDTAVPQFVGNHLQCSNCHLDAGRRPDAAPMWAAYGLYPAYRKKNHHVNTFSERLQECFRYSMNGKMPPPDDPAVVALETYAYWLAKGAPTGVKLKGQGFPKLAGPALPADYARGERLYGQHCAACHQASGAGATLGAMQVPALWGDDSFNWGAGMHQLSNAAGFIKANMPLGQRNSLSDQEAWDLARFIDSQERPQDPRYTGSVEETRRLYHDDVDSMYGLAVNGHVLGTGSTAAGKLIGAAAGLGNTIEARDQGITH